MAKALEPFQHCADAACCSVSSDIGCVSSDILFVSYRGSGHRRLLLFSICTTEVVHRSATGRSSHCQLVVINTLPQYLLVYVLVVKLPALFKTVTILLVPFQKFRYLPRSSLTSSSCCPALSSSHLCCICRRQSQLSTPCERRPTVRPPGLAFKRRPGPFTKI